MIFHPAWFLRTKPGPSGGRCIGTFHGSWLQHGCHLQASKRGLHQTHLRGLPRRPERRLDCGKGSSRCRMVPSSRPRNSAVPRRRPVRGFKMTGSSLAAGVSPGRSGRRGERRPSDGAARRAGSGRVNPPVRRLQIRATVRGPTKANGVGHGDARRVAGSTVTVFVPFFALLSLLSRRDCIPKAGVAPR